MRITFIVLFVLIFFSCKEENTKEDAHCKVDSNLVSEFLKKNKSNVIETEYLANFEQNGCVNIDSFIRLKLRDKESSGKVSDTLQAFLGIEKFETEVTNEVNKENEMIRLIKWVPSYEQNIHVVNLNNKKGGGTAIESYHVIFNDRCSPFIAQKELTKDCFRVVDKNKKTVSDKEWKELKTIIQETDLASTIYHDDGSAIRLCHGASYTIYYSPGYKYENIIKELNRGCPSEKTAIYLVSEKLLEIANGN